jgi:MATE family multidrug resistance protein
MGGSPEMRAQGEIYFRYRILSAPFALTNFCILGWFIGQGRAAIAFVVQIFLNVVNMALGAWFVLSLGMTADGVGLSALIAEISAVLLGGLLIWRTVRKTKAWASWAQIWNREKVLRTLSANGDIMIRTLCLVFAFAWFAARGARAGDVTIAANAVLLHFFEVAAYLIDGFAYASEALVGQSVGAKNRARFNRAVRLTTLWALVVGSICSAIIWFA